MIDREHFTEDQENAFQNFLSFVKSTDRQFLINGYSGTGKTTLLHYFLDYLDDNYEYNVVCTAPTNEAVRVISKLTGRDYDMTIFSLLGLVLQNNEDKEPILKSMGKPKINEYDLVIIDECSMIDRRIVEQLESLLVQYTYVKVIYMGDSAQLPPILDTKNGHKESITFNLQNKVQLTHVVRTSIDNPILTAVTAIRNNLLSPSDVFEHETRLNGTNGITFYEYESDFLSGMYKDFLSDSYSKDSSFVRVIAFQNKTVNEYNLKIRRKLFNSPTLDEYVVGERLIVDVPVTVKINPRVNKIIYNSGEHLNVLAVIQSQNAEYGFRVWKLKVVNFDEVSSKQITKTLSVVFKEDLPLYYSALAEFAEAARNNLYNPDATKSMSRYEAWKDYYKFKESYNWVKYLYAVTVHKVQGSTIQNAYVVDRDLNILTWDNEQRNKLKYVAFSRASERLNIL